MPKFATMIRGQEQDLDFSIKYPMRQSGDKITLYRTQPREIVIELDKNTTEKEIEKLDIPKDVKEKLKDELSRLDYYLVVKYAESGNFSKALSIAETIDSVDDKSKAFHDIAVMYTRAGRNEKALKIADKIETADSKSLALIEIAGKYANTCDYSQTIHVLSQALTITKAIEDPYDNAWQLIEIVNVYAEAKEIQKASEVLSQAHKVIQTIGDDSKSDTLSDRMIFAYEKMELYDEAILMANTIEDANRKEHILARIKNRMKKAMC